LKSIVYQEQPTILDDMRIRMACASMTLMQAERAFTERFTREHNQLLRF